MLQLSVEDKELLDFYISEYSDEHVHHYGHADIDYLLRFWVENKENLFKLLGNELIISKEVIITKDEQTISAEISNGIWAETNKHYSMLAPFYQHLDEWVYKTYNRNDDYREYRNMRGLTDLSYIAKNCYNGETFSIVLPNGKPYRITNGQKMMKIYSKIASAFEIEGFENFRLAHSQILNEKTITGELCLSIHPMDYFTMSHNNCDWSSCLSWAGNGDFRRGCVEMMNSEYVVVAYLKSSEDMDLGEDYSWNSKKWRELFIVTDECISGVKGYPYWNHELEELALNWLVKLAGDKYDPTIHRFEADDRIYIDEEEEIFCEFRFSTGAMYNDFAYRDHCLCMAKNIEPDVYDIDYSGPYTCMICGADDEELDWDDCSNLICLNCYEPHYCAECGCRMYDNEPQYLVGDNVYCSYCYNNLPECSECGEVVDYSHRVYIAADDKHVLKDYHIDLCDDCYEAYIKDGKIHKFKSLIWYGTIDYIKIDDLDKSVFTSTFNMYWEMMPLETERYWEPFDEERHLDPW